VGTSALLTSPLIEVGPGKGLLDVSAGTIRATNITVYPGSTLSLRGGTIVGGTIAQRGTLIATGDTSIDRMVLFPTSINAVDANLTFTGGLDMDLGAAITGSGRVTFSGTSSSSGWGTIAPSVIVSGTSAV